jgi:hypothetical protein
MARVAPPSRNNYWLTDGIIFDPNWMLVPRLHHRRGKLKGHSVHRTGSVRCCGESR